jgi:hypothetical protein
MLWVLPDDQAGLLQDHSHPSLLLSPPQLGVLLPIATMCADRCLLDAGAAGVGLGPLHDTMSDMLLQLLCALLPALLTPG